MRFERVHITGAHVLHGGHDFRRDMVRRSDHVYNVNAASDDDGRAGDCE
jgi:hypothetical protein